MDSKFFQVTPGIEPGIRVLQVTDIKSAFY